MAYNPTTDFVALWRLVAGTASKTSMPGLDFVVAALGRAGLINVSISGTAPVANQSTTAWFKPAVPSTGAEGALFLWDKLTGLYAAATPSLLIAFLQASAGQSGRSWWTSTGGPPLNTVGNDGDFAIRLDGVGGMYGPKFAGAWPLDPIPGSTNTIDQTAMDQTFGNVPGNIIYRDATDWVSLAIGSNGTILAPFAGLPAWRTLTALLDADFSTLRGSILFRGAAAWQAIGPGAEDQVLTTHGAGNDPTWTPKSSEFAPGTRMIFHQSTAPLGWTKSTTLDDVGLRVVSGAVGSRTGTPYSTVFSQTQVGNTTLSVGQMPIHAHSYVNGSSIGSIEGPISLAAQIPSGNAATATAGNSESHTHSVSLNLSYTDVIIAQKDAP